MKVIAGESRHAPVISATVTLSAVALLTFTVAQGHPLKSVAPALGIVVLISATYKSLVRWPSLVGILIAVILFVPIRRYALPSSLSFNLEPYRLLVVIVGLCWISSLLIDPRVRLRGSIVDGPLALLLLAILGSELANSRRVSSIVSADVVKKLMFLASFYIVFYLIVSVIRRRSDIEKMITLLAAGGAVVAFFALIESRTSFNIFDHLHKALPFLQQQALLGFGDAALRGARLRVWASAQHPIALGALLMLLMPLALYKVQTAARHRALWCVAVVLLLLGSLATVSRTAVLMFVTIAFVYLWLRPRQTKRFWPALIPLLIAVHIALPGTLGTLKQSFFPKGGLIAEQQNTVVGSGRLATLGPALRDEFRPNPILGEGYGTRVTRPDDVVRIPNAPITDDQWLSILLETGVVGFAAAFWLFARFVRRTGRAARADFSDHGALLVNLTAAIAAFATGMLTYDTFSFVQVTFVAFILMALGSAAYALPAEAWDRGRPSMRPAS